MLLLLPWMAIIDWKGHWVILVFYDFHVGHSYQNTLINCADHNRPTHLLKGILRRPSSPTPKNHLSPRWLFVDQSKWNACICLPQKRKMRNNVCSFAFHFVPIAIKVAPMITKASFDYHTITNCIVVFAFILSFDYIFLCCDFTRARKPNLQAR